MPSWNDLGSRKTTSHAGFAGSTYVQGVWNDFVVRDVISLSLLNQAFQFGESQGAHLSVLCSRRGLIAFISALSMEAIQVRGVAGLDVFETDIVTSNASSIK